MKKIIGIMAVALLVVVPAFGQNASTIDYFLGLGGDNFVQDLIANHIATPFGGAGYTEGDATVVDADSTLTWSARVLVSGTYNAVNAQGVANAVWDLKLYAFNTALNDYDDVAVGADATVGNTGSSVATAFGFGGPAAAGFYSTINDGAGVAPSPELHAAAFAYSFQVGGAGPAQIQDLLADGGPHLSRKQYPSTLGTAPDGVANPSCTAKSGTAMGMGAGYEQFNADVFATDSTERAGVGIPGAVADCIQGSVVIAEGQMNLTGLTGGKYKLKLVPGRGNNILRGDYMTDACISLATGNFAAAAGTVNGDSILFQIRTVEPPPIASAAESRKAHGAVGTFAIPLTLTGNAAVECRNNGPTQIVVTYGNVAAITGTAAVTAANASVAGTSMAGNQLTINLTGAVDRTCVALTINGVANSAAPAQIAAAHVVKVTALKGDVDANHAVQANDITAVKGKSSLANVTAATFIYDLDLNGKVQANDITMVKALSRLGTITCTN